MTSDRMLHLAIELQRLGVSQAGVIDLLSHHSHDEIERQLAYLPHRKAKRPEAFIVDAIRNRYSAPKELFYASPQTAPAEPSKRLDQGAQPSA